MKNTIRFYKVGKKITDFGTMLLEAGATECDFILDKKCRKIVMTARINEHLITISADSTSNFIPQIQIKADLPTKSAN